MPTWDKKKPVKKPVKKVVKKTTPTKQKEIKTTPVIEDIIQPQINDTQIDANNIDKDSQLNTNNNWVIIFILVILALLAALLFFAKWYIIPWTSNLTNNNPTSGNEATSKVDDWKVKVWDKIKVDYVGKLEDWSIFDSSIEEFAKKAPDYKADSGRKYEPLEFSVWAWQMIKWFDAWVVGMKVGEKKTLTIKPADWYWEATISQDVPRKYLEDNIEQDVPKENFMDYVTKTIPKETLWEKWNNLKIGEKLEDWEISWEVTEITDSWITLKIANTENPFFGKKLVVWAEVEYQWNTITVKKVTDDMVTVNILNKQSPFFGKKLIVWLVWKIPNWEEAKIEKITDETVTVSVKNPQKLAWKTLIFDVELKAIVK